MINKRIVVLIAPVTKKNPTKYLPLLFGESLIITSTGNKAYILIVPSGQNYNEERYKRDIEIAHATVVREKKDIEAFYFYGEEIDTMTHKWAQLAHTLGIEMVPKTEKMKDVLLEYALKERRPDITNPTPCSYLQRRYLQMQ